METTFTYESCTDNNKGPFIGKLAMVFWMPDADRSVPVDPQTITTAALVAQLRRQPPMRCRDCKMATCQCWRRPAST